MKLFSTIALALAALCASAQPLTTFTVSTPFVCNQSICNGVPLDQGGVLNFFVYAPPVGQHSGGNFYLAYTPLNQPSFVICGNAASTYCGLGKAPNNSGMNLATWNIPGPILSGGASGSGMAVYNWIASEPSTGQVFTGTMTVQAHWFTRNFRTGHAYYFVIEDLTVNILDQSTVAILDLN